MSAARGLGWMPRTAGLLVLSIATAATACGKSQPPSGPRSREAVHARIFHGLGKSSDWPATVWASTPPHTNADCTANIVGPNVVILAAHCLTDANPPTTLIEVYGSEGSCSIYGHKCPNNTDIALCIMSTPLAPSMFETLPGRSATFSQVELVGYGSQSMGPPMLNPRRAPVDVVPPTDPGGCLAAKAAVYVGDSGGGAFHVGTGAARTQVGVISAMDGSNEAFIVDLTSKPAQAAIVGFTKPPSKASICGINFFGSQCRPPA